MSGRGCNECGYINGGLKGRLTQEEVMARFIDIHGYRYEYPNLKYTTDREHINILCKTHGIFSQMVISHLKGSGCPKCAGVGGSKSEIEMRDFLKNFTDFEHSNRNILKNNAELDIYIKDKNIAIEFNGIYFHSDKFQDDNYHINKTEQCLKNGIKLIHVFEDEWVNKKDIVKSRLLNIIGKSPNKIFARECKLKEVESKESMQFLKDNHLQGALGAKSRIGLYYKDELVSLMTFGELRKNLGSSKKEDSWELLRFCNKLNISVVGGASKLLKEFEKTHSPQEIISYADLRWSQGELYESLNFELTHKSKPNYFYTRGQIRENRFKYRKDVLVKEGFDKNKTEKEIMKERGFHRIYDCGTLKYTKNQKTIEWKNY